MGVIHKLKPEIKDFILEQKRVNPAISCRVLPGIIEKQFQIKVSKSSINSIFKEAGLSMPIGRRLKKRRRRQMAQIAPVPEVKREAPVEPEAPVEKIEEITTPVPVEPKPEIQIEKVEVPLEPVCTGALLLKAADYLIGGSYYISEAAKNRLNRQEEETVARIESLIYLPLFELDKEIPENLPELWSLVGKRITKKDIFAYLHDLQSVETMAVDIMRIISNTLPEVRCIKLNYPDGNILYLDGQLHTVWSTPHVPYDFSTNIYNIKSYINRYLYKDGPFILFMAPGYDTPTKEFFNFILNLNSQEKSTARLTLYDNRFKELEVVPLEQTKRRFFIFGLWPWQFLEHRKVTSIAEFKPLYFEPLKKEFFLAQIEMELSQPNVKQTVTLRGVALKTSLNEKSRLVILSNFPAEAVTTEALAMSYLNHWSNLEEAFQDFSRKIELFTYTANSQRFFSAESLNTSLKSDQGIPILFNHYLKVLDLYVKWHFLPSGSEDMDFSTINERFYSLKARIDKGKDYILVAFQPPPGYPYLKELEYACRRINEREVKDYQGRGVWLTTLPY